MFRTARIMESSLNRLLQTHSHLQARSFGSVIQGSKYTPEYTQYLKLPNGEIGSYFHDVPLGLNQKDQTVNMVVEVPRWSNGKFEISTKKRFNPITQDMKKGKVRFVNNIFPFHGYIHNYGAIPQTWEDPTVESSHDGIKGLKGDNDPLDCCEIGSAVLQMGDVKKVKVLGSLALIDDGELDWKIIVINVEDPLSTQVNNLNDVRAHFPGLLEATRKWFRDYKIPTGKPANEFAFEGEYREISETLDVIAECHQSWKKLLKGEVISEKLPETKRAGGGVSLKEKKLPDSSIPSEVQRWYYI